MIVALVNAVGENASTRSNTACALPKIMAALGVFTNYKNNYCINFLIIAKKSRIIGVLSLEPFHIYTFLGTFYLFYSPFFGSSNQSAKVAGSRPPLAPFMHSTSSSSSWAVAASIVCLLGLLFHFLCFVSGFVWFRFVSLYLLMKCAT